MRSHTSFKGIVHVPPTRMDCKLHFWIVIEPDTTWYAYSVLLTYILYRESWYFRSKIVQFFFQSRLLLDQVCSLVTWEDWKVDKSGDELLTGNFELWLHIFHCLFIFITTVSKSPITSRVGDSSNRPWQTFRCGTVTNLQIYHVLKLSDIIWQLLKVAIIW